MACYRRILLPVSLSEISGTIFTIHSIISMTKKPPQDRQQRTKLTLKVEIPSLVYLATRKKQRHELLEAPCGDYYCGECLEQLFRQSMTDETLFPPRCHTQEIPIAQAKGLIEPALAIEFDAKYLELSTANRTYCHDPVCATFISPADIVGDIGRCRGCHKTTCALCKGRTHDGEC